MSIKTIQRKYKKDNPWVKYLGYILTRCNSKNHWYYKKGIKNFLQVKDLKFLWLRDKAYLMKQPSIDRVNRKGHYKLDNCRFIEFIDNLKHRGLEVSIKQLDINKKLIKIWESISLASRILNIAKGAIGNVVVGRQKTAGGFKWEKVLRKP